MLKNYQLKTVVFLCALFSLNMANAQSQEKQLERESPVLFTKFNINSNLSLSRGTSILRRELARGKSDYAFERVKTEQDDLGYTFESFQQSYKGIKVEFSIQKLHALKGRVVTLSGEFYEIENLDLTPALPSIDAFKSAINFVGAKHYLWEDVQASKVNGNYVKPKGEMVILPNLDQYGQLNLAYKFDIYATEPISRDYIYVDAQSGQILLVTPVIKHLGEFSHKGVKNVESNSFEAAVDALATGNAATRYSGNRDITTRIISGQYALRDNTRGNGVNTYNSGRSNSYPSTNFFDNDNNWTAAEYDNAFKDNGALDAHWGAESTYDYWMTQHNRNSFNGSGAAINSYVHYDNIPGGVGYDNAFWNGSVMTYGDGNNFDILTSLDVAAHEIGHAVTTFTGNMAYRRESGALNEGYSDVWGAAVEYFAKGGGTDSAPLASVWAIGEDISTSGGLRSMSDPKSKGDPDTYRGTNWRAATAAEGCITPSRDANDYCGVHSNSGVLNHWFYILVAGKTGTNDIGSSFSVTGIGMTKSAKIAYRLLNNYLSANSTFANARSFGIQSAEELYGVGSPEVIETTNAWYAVGVGAEYGGGGTTGCSNTVSSFPYNEGFESGLGAWSQGSGDDFNWARLSGGTPSSSTGPAGASEGSFYVYAETSNPNNPSKTTILNSPCFDLSGESQATVAFKYQMTGNAVGSVKLEASSDGGSSFSQVWSQSGDQGSAWKTASVSLASYAGGDLQLRLTATSGSSWQGDIAIDDISLSTSGSTGGSGCTGGISSFPYAQGFENTLGGWTQSNSDDIDWSIDANGTPSTGTGPSSAIQGSYYIYIEASGDGAGFPNKRAILTSPCMDLTAFGGANVSFKYHMLGNSVGRIDLEASSDNGATWTSVWNRSGSQGSAWQTANVDISAYAGASVQLRLNGITSTSWQGDITIDDLSVSGSSSIASSFIEEGLVESNDWNISIYPNPNSGSVLLVDSSLDGVNYEIVNAAGQKVLNGTLESNQIQIGALSKGVYILKLIAGQKAVTKRFIRQ